MKNTILRDLLAALFVLLTLPCIGQLDLIDIKDITDFSQLTKLYELLPGHLSAQSQQRTSGAHSQLDYIGYTLAWDYDDMEYDSASRSQLVTEEVDGKLNWILTLESYDSLSGSYLSNVKIELFNFRILTDEDPGDGSAVPADSLLLYVYDDAIKEYVLFLTTHYFANEFGKLDYSVITIYLYGTQFVSVVQQYYYDTEERLIAVTSSNGFTVQDSTVFSYNSMDQLIQEATLNYDEYGGESSSEVTDYSYNGDASLSFLRTMLYSDWLTTLAGIDSTAYTYPSQDMYIESVYFFDEYSGSYVLDFYWEYTSTEDKEIEAQYREGTKGLVNVEYIESTNDECDRTIDVLNVLRLLDGTEDSREFSLFFYREDPSCTVSTNQVESAQDQFTYIMDDQLLSIFFEESDQGILSMHAVDGRTVRSVRYLGVQGDIDVSQLASGIYYVSIRGKRFHGVVSVFVK